MKPNDKEVELSRSSAEECQQSGESLPVLLKRSLSARLGRRGLLSSSLRKKKAPKSDEPHETEQDEKNTEAGNLLNRIMRQMSTLTVNYASQRQRWRSNYMHENAIPQSVSHSNNLNKPENEEMNALLNKCNTLPARLDYTPGVVGLRNHGNTCFINAVLQCLSHTDILAEYFVTNQYQTDLKKRSRVTSRKFGTKGEVTEQFAELLKALWSSQYDPEMTTKFKILIDKYGTQYRGANQHDAQEFLLWLLDKVHEDLNTATKKKYKKVKNSYGRPDEVVAAETLANHLRCNSSFIQQLFQAQFRSSLTCPHCLRQSSTFDPFLCVSLPIARKTTHSVYVTVLYLCQQPRQVRLGLSMSGQSDLRDLREILSSDTGIEENLMLLTEIDDQGFLRTFNDHHPVTVISDMDPLYCIELPTPKEPSEEDGAFIVICWINVLVTAGCQTRFGSPYSMQIGRETSFEDLQTLILKEMASVVHHSVLCSTQEGPLFQIRVVDGVCRFSSTESDEDAAYLDPSLEHPLYAEAVDTALSLCDPNHGTPYHVKLVLEWDPDTKHKVIVDDSDRIEEHASVAQVKSNQEENNAVTLEDCFELYTQAEQLGPEDAWHCPSCNRKQEVVKKLSLWSLPDILIVHLKRFKQSPKQRTMSKLSVMVDFPIHGLDLTSHLVSRGSTVPTATENQGNTLSSWRSIWSPLRRRSSVRVPGSHIGSSGYNGSNRRLGEESTYDLYAVCNHHGTDLVGGHYTAYCKNPTDGQWYLFDDTRVTRVPERDIVTSAAYILFYQRRVPNTSGSSEASSSSSGSEHWAFRLPRNQNPIPTSFTSRRASIDSSTLSRNDRRYATLPGNGKRVSANEDARWSDSDAVALNGDWGTPEIPRRSVGSQTNDK